MPSIPADSGRSRLSLSLKPSAYRAKRQRPGNFSTSHGLLLPPACFDEVPTTAVGVGATKTTMKAVTGSTENASQKPIYGCGKNTTPCVDPEQGRARASGEMAFCSLVSIGVPWHARCFAGSLRWGLPGLFGKRRVHSPIHQRWRARAFGCACALRSSSSGGGSGGDGSTIWPRRCLFC